MLTIDDLNRIINLPSTSLNINEKKVEEVVSFRNELIPYVDNLNFFTNDFVNDLNGIVSYWYMLQKNPWIKDKCVVGLMGAYNAGKSTLINYLLGTNLPTGINPVTAVSTYIAYGNENKHFIVDNDENLKLIPNDLENRLSHEETKGFNLRKIIAHTVLYNQSKILKKISFLDTPGISADNEYDYTITADAANKCDVVIWAVRANAGAITQFEIDFIKKYLSEKKIFIVVTHADKSPNPDKILQSILKQLSNAEIRIEDSFFFGLRATRSLNMEKQLNRIIHVLNNEIRTFKAVQPQEQLNGYMSFIQSHLETRINETTDKKQEMEKICRQYEYRVENIKHALSNDTESLRRSINNLCDTINGRCRNPGLCTKGPTGAYTLLVKYHNAMVDNYNKIAKSISDIDIEELVTYGKASSYLSRISDVLDSLVASRNKCVELISKSNNLFN